MHTSAIGNNIVLKLTPIFPGFCGRWILRQAARWIIVGESSEFDSAAPEDKRDVNEVRVTLQFC